MKDEDALNEELRNRVKKRLEELDLSPTAAATNVGLNRAFIWDFVTRRKASITVDKLTLVASALETTVEYLLQGIGQAASEMKLPERDGTTKPHPRKGGSALPIMSFDAVGNDKASIHVEATVPWEVAMTIIDLAKKSQGTA